MRFATCKERPPCLSGPNRFPERATVRLQMRHGWSIETAHWAVMNHHLQDTHWIGVPFADFASAAVPAELGNYMIIALPPLIDSALRELRSPLYVGRSNDLRRRMREHLNGRLRKRLSAFSRLAFLYAFAPTEPVNEFETRC